MATSTSAWWAGALAPLDWSVWLSTPPPGIRIEDVLTADGYVLRAELPGVDPARDIHITCQDGILCLRVTRTARQPEARTEFRYGTFERLIELPLGARHESIRATYQDGILEITVKMGDPDEGTEIPVEVTGSVPR